MNAPLTPETTFGYVPSIDANLFSVPAGIPLAIAAEQCACGVDAATETVRRVACMISADDGAHLLWSAVYSLTMAHGLIESIQAALEDAETPDLAPQYFIAPTDHTGPGPFTWIMVDPGTASVIESGQAATWSAADDAAVAVRDRLMDVGIEPAPAPASADIDPDLMQRVWTNVAKTAMNELAKLDETKPAASWLARRLEQEAERSTAGASKEGAQ